MESPALRHPVSERAESLTEPLYLHLSITDPETAQALTEAGEGRDRQEFALTALRIGILSLKAARGTIDGATVRYEGDRLLGSLEERLSAHRQVLDEALGGTLRAYFDPSTGAFTAHSADRGHPFQADRGQRSGRSRTPWVECLSDGPDGRATVRHQRGTLCAISAQRVLPGYPRGAPGAGWVTRCRRRFPGWGCAAAAALSTAAAAHRDAAPPRWARRAEAGPGWCTPDAVRLAAWPGAATRPSARWCARRAAAGP